MRVQIEFVPADGREHVGVPLHYNKAVQGLIYALIRPTLPHLHDEGYTSSGRAMRLFVFSRLLGKVIEVKNGCLVFRAPVAVKVASPHDSFIEALAEGLLRTPTIDLAGVKLVFSGLSVQKAAGFPSNCALFTAISPVTVYSTLFTSEGKKKTYYYHPSEPEFAQQIKVNLGRKAALLGLGPKITESIALKSVRVRSSDQKVLYFKDTVVKGWLGQYVFEGDPAMLQVALDCGIGAKNSQGFGMLELI
ncbi:CRISPR-associated endoribonuclease [Gelria sp. Kuro-4]|nr:CRISPR-associated endoribonuclease [Gelria sp. Kuro-4]